jgi:hypothetical protein
MFELKRLNIPAQDNVTRCDNHDNLAQNIWAVNSDGYVTIYYGYGTTSGDSLAEDTWEVNVDSCVAMSYRYGTTSDERF